MMFRTSILATFAAAAFLVTACATPGRGGSVDDDDGSSGDESLTTTGSGTSTSSGGSGSGAGTGGNAASTSTTSSGGPTTTGGATCTYANLEFNDATCGGCVETACCSSLQTCDGSTLCLDFLDCLGLCTDQLCADACVESNPSGSIEYDTLNTCMNNSCPVECATG